MNILGTNVAAVDMEGAVDCLRTWIEHDCAARYVCLTGVHGIMEGLRDPEVQRVHNRAAACFPDGMPTTWIGRVRGYKDMRRVYGPDLMLRMMEVSTQKGYSNYFLGGGPGVADHLKASMELRFPGLRVVGTYAPPFRPLTSDEEDRLLAEVDGLKPDLLWIGLSTPKQEMFMATYCSRLTAKVLLGVGAAFDFHSGRVKQAPRWVMAAGLEWAFRAAMEPRRLGRRYLRNNPPFVLHALLELARIRVYPPTT